MDFKNFDEGLFETIQETIDQNYSRALDDADDAGAVLEDIYYAVKEYLKDNGIYD